MDLCNIIPSTYESLKFVFPPQTYSPAEDTELLLKNLKDWIKSPNTYPPRPQNPKILEIGTGPGTLILILIHLLHLQNIHPEAYAIDINPDAIETAKYNAKLNHLENYCIFFTGNLFTPINTTERFDLIFFNPPYLAAEPEVINAKNRKPIDATWEGGINGDECTLEFLTQASLHLAKNGMIFFIASDLVLQSNIVDTIQSNNMEIIITDKIHVFFEDILFYALRKKL